MIITVSLRNMFFDCPKKFFNFYVRRLQRKATPAPLQWGSLVHRALAVFDNMGLEGVDLCVAEIRHEIEEGLFSAEDLNQLDSMLRVLPRAVGAYALRYINDAYENVELEREFSLTLPSGKHTFRGKIDAIVKRKGENVLYLKERKTAARTGDAYYERLPRDPQLRGYVTGARKALKLPVQSVLYDVLKKPQLYRRAGESDESYMVRLGEEYLLRKDELCERRIIPMASMNEDAYLAEMNEVADMIEWCIARGTFPGQCAGNRLGRCSYEPLCSQSAEHLYSQRPQEELHPELEASEGD